MPKAANEKHPPKNRLRGSPNQPHNRAETTIPPGQDQGADRGPSPNAGNRERKQGGSGIESGEGIGQGKASESAARPPDSDGAAVLAGIGNPNR
jgi:hypothetical protein